MAVAAGCLFGQRPCHYRRIGEMVEYRIFPSEPGDREIAVRTTTSRRDLSICRDRFRAHRTRAIANTLIRCWHCCSATRLRYRLSIRRQQPANYGPRLGQDCRKHLGRTQDEIIDRQPPAKTAAGALLALDHVLRNEDLFGERDECAIQQMLWVLIKSARDYIATAHALDLPKCDT